LNNHQVKIGDFIILQTNSNEGTSMPHFMYFFGWQLKVFCLKTPSWHTLDLFRMILNTKIYKIRQEMNIY